MNFFSNVLMRTPVRDSGPFTMPLIGFIPAARRHALLGQHPEFELGNPSGLPDRRLHEKELEKLQS